MRLQLRLTLLLLLPGIFLLLTITHPVSADDGIPVSPNTGKYVYQDKEYITNAQYDTIVAANKKISKGHNPQVDFIIIVDHLPADYQLFSSDQEEFVKHTDITKSSYASDLSEMWIQHTEKKHIDDNSGKYLYLGEKYNFLILSIKDKKIGYTGVASGHFTDLKMDLLLHNYNNGIQSDDTNTQVATFIKFVDKFSTEQVQTVKADNIADADSKSWQDIKSTMEMISGWVIFLSILLLAFRKYGEYGDDDGGNNGNYDEGFYDGMLYDQTSNHDNNIF
ncbi:hypothetical protein [Companilactobacillus mishanensis]|uniref:TPM domain-containing protein n=1 Tax=Companilactobacillus mishanensis TaxID=2486008 RepID=A0ABW9P7J3_9LACO|nr:hypothetical protein [Companilactobacillus mishanensis]MQS45176.1 hypothetical protein [Companilactobacillus mishanensis]